LGDPAVRLDLHLDTRALLPRIEKSPFFIRVETVPVLDHRARGSLDLFRALFLLCAQLRGHRIHPRLLDGNRTLGARFASLLQLSGDPSDLMHLLLRRVEQPRLYLLHADCSFLPPDRDF
jgi:hypothetical protein